MSCSFVLSVSFITQISMSTKKLHILFTLRQCGYLEVIDFPSNPGVSIPQPVR